MEMKNNNEMEKKKYEQLQMIALCKAYPEIKKLWNGAKFDVINIRSKNVIYKGRILNEKTFKLVWITLRLCKREEQIKLFMKIRTTSNPYVQKMTVNGIEIPYTELFKNGFNISDLFFQIINYI